MGAMDSAQPYNPHGPALLLIRGLPGSGKSYLARALRDYFGPDRVLLLDPDATDYNGTSYAVHVQSMEAQGIEAKFHPYRFLRGQAETAIATRKIVIWNQAFTLLGGVQRTVDHLQDVAASHDLLLPTLIVEVAIDHETAKARVAARASDGGHDVSPEAFERFISDYRSFADEGFNTIGLQGTDNIEAMVSAVVTALAEASSAAA
jgi:predicted kinase